MLLCVAEPFGPLGRRVGLGRGFLAWPQKLVGLICCVWGVDIALTSELLGAGSTTSPPGVADAVNSYGYILEGYWRL